MSKGKYAVLSAGQNAAFAVEKLVNCQMNGVRYIILSIFPDDGSNSAFPYKGKEDLNVYYKHSDLTIPFH